jgi:S1-C subfamily serine protease
MTDRFGLPGVLILDVSPRSTAAAAGLRPTRRTAYGELIPGDLVVAIDDAPIDSTEDFLLAFEKYKIGDRATLTVIRGRKRTKIEVELEATD